MQQLDLEHAQAGMVLAAPALGRQGQLLLCAGTVLSDRHLQILRANAVGQIRVGAAGPRAGATRLSVDGDIDTHIAARFSLCDARHPLIDELRRICRQRLNQAPEERDDDG